MNKKRPMFPISKKLVRNERAVAAVEFALVSPLMLALYMGSMEVSQVITVDKKVSTVASSVGDLVARADGSIDATTVDDYINASNVLMSPYPASNLKQRVTSVYVDNSGQTNVEWSISYNGAEVETLDSTFNLPTHIVNLAKNGYVIVSESETGYRPWGGYVIDQDFTLYKVFYHLPRFGEEIALNGSSSTGEMATTDTGNGGNNGGGNNGGGNNGGGNNGGGNNGGGNNGGGNNGGGNNGGGNNGGGNNGGGNNGGGGHHGGGGGQSGGGGLFDFMYGLLFG